jgi:Protein of unknown function (DUF3105)
LATVLVLLGGCSSRSAEEPRESDAKPPVSEFQPVEGNQDPSTKIEGVEVGEHQGGMHTLPGQRVAYDKHPPLGGAHDEVWAACNGIVYTRPVRTEHMVHSLEHGALWIAYDPKALTEPDIATLAAKVDGQPYLMLSPYPDLDQPISLQAWNHQLKLERVDDERVDQFIQALRDNEYTAPEPGAPCEIDPGLFDPTNPPPFDPSPPGADAMPVDGK